MPGSSRSWFHTPGFWRGTSRRFLPIATHGPDFTPPNRSTAMCRLPRGASLGPILDALQRDFSAIQPGRALDSSKSMIVSNQR